MSSFKPSPRYEVLGEIARGGMGVVYRVRDVDLDRILAMKRLSRVPASSEDQQADYYTRFLEEVQVTAQLDHPSIVPIVDLGFDEDGVPFYTMRYVKGRTLGEVIDLTQEEKEGWTLTRLLEVLVKVCQALAHAHAKGVLHRDLKPANIMVGDLGEVYVMDWGLARMLGREDVRDLRLHLDSQGGLETIASVREVDPKNPVDASLMTMDGTIVGTPAYMAPEQALGKIEEMDHLSDVYALGCILYRMLAGHPPYMPIEADRTTAAEVLTQLQSKPPERLQNGPVKHSPELVAICEKAMSRERDKRYPSALSLSQDLQAYLEGRVVQAHQTGPLVEMKKWVTRNRALALAAALAALSLLAFTVSQVLSKQQLNQANQELAHSLEDKEQARAEVAQTLAEMYTTQGLTAESKARAALWFSAAATLQREDPAAFHASRTRMRTWTDSSHVPLRAFRLERAQRTRDAFFHPTLPLLIVESPDEAEIWDLRTQETPLFPGQQFRCAAWDPVSGLLATSIGDSEVHLWDSDKELVRVIETPNEQVTRLTFSPDGALLGIGGHALHLWNVGSETWIGLSRPHPDPVAWITFDEKQRLVATASGNEARLFEVKSASADPVHPPFPHYRWLAHSLRPFQPTFHQGQLVTSGGDLPRWRDAFQAGDYRLRFWDLVNGQEQRAAVINPQLVDPSGSFLYTDRAMLDFETLQTIYSMSGDEMPQCGDFSPDGGTFFGWNQSGHLRMTRSGETLGRLAESYHDGSEARALKVAPHGRYFAVVLKGASSKPLVFVFSAWQKPKTTTISAWPVPADGTLSSDQRWFAYTGLPQGFSPAYQSQATRVFSAETGDPAGPILKPGGEVTAAAFGHDGTTLLIGTGSVGPSRQAEDYQNGQAQLWDWQRGVPRGPRVTLPSEPRDAVALPDGGFVILCHNRELVRIDEEVTLATVLYQNDSRSESGAPSRREAGFRLSLLEDGTLISQGRRDEIHLWSSEALANGGTPQVIPHGLMGAESRCTNDEALFVADRQAPTFGVFDLSNQQRDEVNAEMSGGAIKALAWSDTRRQLVSGSHSGLAQVWDYHSPSDIRATARREHPSDVISARFIPETPWILTEVQSQDLHCWDAASGRIVAPSIPVETFQPFTMRYLEKSHRMVISPWNGAKMLDLAGLAPDPRLEFEAARQLMELHAHGQIDEGGTFVKFARNEWFDQWQAFRADHPHYHEALINPPLETQARWHREEALRLKYTHTFAYQWHLKRWAAISDSEEAASRMQAAGLE